MRIAWVLGWAVPAEWFAAEASRVWPRAEHLCVPAAPDWRARLAALPACDAVGGYSLGTLLLLGSRTWVAERWSRVGLLAPIWAFPEEAGRGGRVPLVRLRALARRVRVEPGKACAEFRAWAGFGEACGATEPVDSLRWGLGQLEACVAEPGLPEGWSAFVGERDVLLDPEGLARESSLMRTVAREGHAPTPLVAAWAREIDAT
jgi:hypothetical protein